MNKLTGLTLAGGMLLMSSQAATIDWTTNAITDFETDVVTNGTLLEAINGAHLSRTETPTVNGVTFISDGTLLGGNWNGDPWASTNVVGDYDILLSTVDFEGAGTDPYLLKTFSGLTVGAEYQVQVWHADDGAAGAGRTMTYDGTGQNVLDGESFAVGAFTANAVTQALVVTASQSGPRLTAYQLRAISGHIDPDPAIELSVSELTFNATYVGTTNSLALTVKNAGGGVLDGTASIAAPYAIDSGATYSLSNNQEQVITVLFAPQSVGEVTNTLSCTGGGGTDIPVYGTGELLLGTLAADIAGDYSGPSAAPEGWYYLYSDAAIGGNEFPLVPDSPAASAFGGGNVGFGDTNGQYGVPAVLGSVTGGGQYEIFSDGYDGKNSDQVWGHFGEPGADLLMHPGSSNENSFVIVRYTFSAEDLADSSTVSIMGSFRDECGKTVSPADDSITAEIYHNSTSLFSATGVDGRLWQTNGTFNITDLSVAVGDTISFVVGNNGLIGGDETALSGIILVQQPTTPVILPGVELISGNIEFQFTGAIGAHYQVESTEQLSGPDWQPVQDVNPLTVSPKDVSIPATDSAAFYRVKYIP